MKKNATTRTKSTGPLKVIVSRSNVTTIEEAAAALAKTYGWNSYKVSGSEITFKAEVNGKETSLRLILGSYDAVAVDMRTGEEVEEMYVDYETMDWHCPVLAHTEDGNVVLLHN